MQDGVAAALLEVDVHADRLTMLPAVGAQLHQYAAGRNRGPGRDVLEAIDQSARGRVLGDRASWEDGERQEKRKGGRHVLPSVRSSCITPRPHHPLTLPLITPWV